MYALVKDNGRLILAFKNQEWFLEFIELIETDVNEYGDDWHQVGNTERFGEVVVAEFWTEEKYEFEESRYYDDMTRAYFDIDEEPHRKTVWDVYSTSELL